MSDLKKRRNSLSWAVWSVLLVIWAVPSDGLRAQGVEQYGNTPTGLSSGRLASGINSSTTTITLAAGSRVPTVPPFSLWIHSEILRCTAVSLPVLTCTRHDEGTTAVAHASGQPVYVLPTDRSLKNNPLALTTTGDLSVLNEDLEQDRIPIGADGDVLTVVDGMPSWEEPATGAGTGDVVGPASATDNAIPRFDSTTGKLLQNSGITIADGATGTLAGSNSGDQTITLTGDVTGSGPGSFAATIAAGVVSYAKIQNVSATDKLLGRSTAGAGSVEEIACPAACRALLDDVDAAAQRVTLGLAIGTNVQAYDAELAAVAGLTSAADKLPYFTGSGTAAVADFTAAGRAIVDDADASAQRTTLGLGSLATQSGTFSGSSSGTNTGDQTITLTGDVTGSGPGSFAATIAAGVVSYAKIQNVSATDKLLGRSTAGAGSVEEIACPAACRALLDDVDAAAQRTTLGLGSLATQSGTFSGTSSGTNTGDQDLSGYVPTTRTVNGHALSANVSVTATDVGLGNVENAAASGLYVPLTRTVNGHALSGDVSVTLADVGGAPVGSQYWTGAADATLSAEKNLGALGTGLVINTGGTPSAYAGSSCTNQFARSLDASGAATCNTVTSADVDSSIGLVANPLSQFATTTSAQLTGVISDENGSGPIVATIAPQLETPDLGDATGTSVELSGNAEAATYSVDGAPGASKVVVVGSTRLVITNGLITGAAAALPRGAPPLNLFPCNPVRRVKCTAKGFGQ